MSYSGEIGGDAESPTPVPRVQTECNRAIRHPQKWLRLRSCTDSPGYEPSVVLFYYAAAWCLWSELNARPRLYGSRALNQLSYTGENGRGFQTRTEVLR